MIYLFHLACLVLITILSYGDLLRLYFWHDDYTTLYQIQQGKLMWFPYHFISIITKFLYPIFGLNPQGYLTIELLLYILAAFLLYFLLIRIINNRWLALLASTIYCAGYIGVDELKMPLGTGLASVLALSTLLLAFHSLISFTRQKRIIFFLLTFFFIFITLEIAPYRYGGFIFAFIFSEVILFKKIDTKGALTRIFFYCLLFFVQYKVHPTKFIFDYAIEKDRQIILDWRTLFYSLGNFWNLIFPSKFTYELYHLLKPYGEKALVLLIFPSYFFSSMMLIISNFQQKLKPSKLLLLFTSICIVIAVMIHFLPNVSFENKILSTNGSIIILFFFTLYLSNRLIYPRYALFSLIIIFSGFILYAASVNSSTFESYHRYMLPFSFTPSLAMLFFILKGYNKSKLSLIFFLIPILFLSISHLVVGKNSLEYFYKYNSYHANNIFTLLKKELSSPIEKSIIYIEPKTIELNHILGEVFRVGALPSEATLAVHYTQPISNLLLAESLSSLVKLQESNSISDNNFYTFIYDGYQLENTSSSVKNLRRRANSLKTYSNSIWKKEGDEFTAVFDQQIQTQRNIQATLLFTDINVSSSQQTRIEWHYDNCGLIQDNHVFKTLHTGSPTLAFKFTIPACGKYLQEIQILSFNSLPNSLILEYE